MGLIHDSFIAWLHHQRHHERLNNYNVYDSYYNGDHEVKIPAKVKAALESELGTVMNYTRIVVDASVDYIAGGEVGLEAEDNSAAEAFLIDIYGENDLFTVEMLKTITVMGKKGDVFLKLYIEDSQIKVSVLRPDICFPRYRTDDYRELLYCAVQWFEERDYFRENEGFWPEIPDGGQWRAQVFRREVVDYYVLEGDRDDEKTQWELIHSEKNILGFIPIIHIKNTIDDLEFGTSDIQIMSDLQDALNKTVTDMLLTMDNQAFQRLWIFGAQTPKGEEVSQEPGIITEVPTAEGHLDLVPPASIEPFISAMRDIVDHICTISQISKIAIMKPESAFPESGFALRMHFIPQERKAGKKIAVLQAQFQKLNHMIFKAAAFLGLGDYVGTKTKLTFSGGLPTDEQMEMQIDEMEIRTKIRSRRSIMQKRGVENVDKEMKLIEQEEDDFIKKAFNLEIEKAEALASIEENHLDEMEIRNKIRSRRSMMQKRGVENVDKEMELVEQEEDDLIKKAFDLEVEKAEALASIDEKHRPPPITR